MARAAFRKCPQSLPRVARACQGERITAERASCATAQDTQAEADPLKRAQGPGARPAMVLVDELAPALLEAQHERAPIL